MFVTRTRIFLIVSCCLVGHPAICRGQEIFKRGDANADGKVDISDVLSVVNHLFLGGAAPPCSDAADANDDGSVDISDALAVVNFLFLGGAPIPPPGPTNCGPDPTADAAGMDLGCRAYPRRLCGIVEVPDTRHWDFEDGTLQGWVATGAAFDSQPTYGNNVSTRRAMQRDADFMALVDSIGGDYWNGPYPIGIQGQYWIGTYENRPNRGAEWSAVQGDSPRGTLTSPEFTLGKRYVHFLIGGGCDVDGVRVELQVRAQGDTTWAPVVASRRTGRCDERMERAVLDLVSLGVIGGKNPPAKGRLVIRDQSAGGWGHINVDDIWVTDDPPSGEQPPVWGFADTHAHLSAMHAFDGLAIWGDTEHLGADGSVKNPLTCPGTAHNANAGVSTSKVLYEMEDQHRFGRKAPQNTEPTPHDAIGALNSSWHSLSHQQMYERWVRRAYSGGLRLLVTEAVNSRVLAWGLSGTHPDVGPSKDSASYMAQIRDTKDLVRRNSDWMEIALTPADARRIIRRNKLAVVLGIEVDSFADCDIRTLPTNDGNHYHAGSSGCDIDKVITALDAVYAEGVRQLHPIHLTDNGFGGAAVYNDEFNISNHYLNNQFFSVANGTSSGVDWSFEANPSFVGTVRFGDIIISKTVGAWPSPVYSTSSGHVNALGLTDRGRRLIREMMKRGMVIAVDHLSEKALDELIGLPNPTTGGLIGSPLVANEDCEDLSREECRELAYPVALTHSGARDLQFRRNETNSKAKRTSEGGKRLNQIRRINLIGGIAAPGIAVGDVKSYVGPAEVANDCAGTACSFAQVYNFYMARRASELHGVHFGMPIGTDLNGLNGSVGPRYGIWGCWKRNFHIAAPDLSAAASLPNPPGQDNDWEQRTAQINGRSGVRYEFHGSSSFVAHMTAPAANWHTRGVRTMTLTTDQPPLKPATRPGSPPWDINLDGVAHYGMLPDFFQDLRAVGFSREDLGPLFLGAEAYIRMWEKAWEQRDLR